MSNPTPRVYAACLSSYNAGKLHGKWIDCDQGEEHIREEVYAMLKDSPEPDAEEYGWHDHEYMPNISESEDMEKLAAIGEALASSDEPEALLDWMKSTGSEDVERFEDEFAGKWESLEDFAENFYYDVYGENALGCLHTAIDWSKVAYDMRCSGYWESRTDCGVFVYQST